MGLERQIKTTRSCTVNGDDPGVQSPDSAMTRPDFGTTSRPARALRTLTVFLVALAALLGSHGTAQAQTDVWSATLTVGASGSVVGFAVGLGTLSDTTITVGTTDYTIDGISIVGGGLFFNLSSTGFGDAATHLVLHVDTQTFAFSEASFLTSTHSYLWTSNVPSWSENDSVALSITAFAVPDAPTNLTATAGDQKVDLSWTAPASDGGTMITDYEYEQNGSGTWISTGVTTTSYTVRNLTNGQSYTFKVRAVNSVGESTASAASSSVTPATAPGAPTGLSATAGNQQVALSWTAPASNGGVTITDYEYSQNGSATWTSTGGTATSYTVRNLTNGQSYTFRVRAVNRVGESTASAASSSVTPATAPGAPTSLSATVGNQQVELSWTEPASNGRGDDPALRIRAGLVRHLDLHGQRGHQLHGSQPDQRAVLHVQGAGGQQCRGGARPPVRSLPRRRVRRGRLTRRTASAPRPATGR